MGTSPPNRGDCPGSKERAEKGRGIRNTKKNKCSRQLRPRRNHRQTYTPPPTQTTILSTTARGGPAKVIDDAAGDKYNTPSIPSRIQDGYYWEERVLVFLETCFVQTATIPRNVDKTTTLLFPKLKPLNNILGHGGINTVSTNDDDIIKIGTRLLYIATRLVPATWCLYTKDRPTRHFRVNNCIQPTATTLHNVVIHNVFHGRFSFQIKTIKASCGTQILTYPCHTYVYMFFYDVQSIL
jgi:hypothetical protein